MVTPPCPSRQSSKPRAALPTPAPPEIAWAGLDVAKATFEAALFTPAADAGPQKPLAGMPGCGFERTPNGAARFVAWALAQTPRPARLTVVMEATGRYSTELARWIAETNGDMAVVIADPYKIAKFAESLGTRNRTDRADARIIARFAAERRPEARPAAAPEYERLRELVRERRRVVEQRCRLENRMGEGTSIDLIRRQWKLELAQLRRHEKALDDEIEALRRENETLRADNEARRQIAGVGAIVAATLQGEAGDPRRFATARAYAAYCGLSPQTKDSGTSVRQARLSKRGSPEARRVLYLAAMAAVRTKKPNRFQEYYRRRVRGGMTPKSALIAVERKIMVAIHCMITRGQPYDDAHKPTWNTNKDNEKRPALRHTIKKKKTLQ